jgi:hypothetical protein
MPSRQRVVGPCDRRTGVVFLLFSTDLYFFISFISLYLSNLHSWHEGVYKEHSLFSENGGSDHDHRLHSRKIPATIPSQW